MALLLKEEKVGSVKLPAHLEEFAAKVKLWEAIGLKSPEVTASMTTRSRYHEISPLTDLQAVDLSANALANMLTEDMISDTSETRSDIFTMLLELLSNCFHHARTADGLHGLACAQTWYNDTRAQIAIADSGIGIRKSLWENPDLRVELRQNNACTLACQLGVSSKLGRGHAGYGLAIAKDIAMQNRNSLLFVQSCNEALYIENKNATEISDFEHALPGTLIVFEWDLGTPLNLGNVYSQWPAGKDNDSIPDFF